MAVIPIKTGSGANTDFVTADSGKILYPYVGANEEGEPITGNIQTQNDSGNVSLTAQTTSKSYPIGYYPNAHGAQITLEEKLGTNNNGITPTTSYQDITPANGKVLSKVRIGAIPNQKSDSGNVTLNGTTTSKSYVAGYYANAHGAQVTKYNGEWG